MKRRAAVGRNWCQVLYRVVGISPVGRCYLQGTKETSTFCEDGMDVVVLRVHPCTAVSRVVKSV